MVQYIKFMNQQWICPLLILLGVSKNNEGVVQDERTFD